MTTTANQSETRPDSVLFERVEVKVALKNGALIFGLISSPLDHITHSFTITPWGCKEPLRLRLIDVKRSEVASVRFAKFQAIARRQREELGR